MRHLEEGLQVECVKWFRLQYPKLEKLLHHSPNGGFRYKSTAARFKKMGTRAGFPDLVLLVPRNGIHALFVEMKTDTGSQTKLQKEYCKLLEGQGYKYVVCRSIGEFIEIVTGYLGESNEKTDINEVLDFKG